MNDIRTKYKNEIRTHGEQISAAEGFVYMLEHPAYTGWIKVGMTIDFETRLLTYNVGDPHKGYSYIKLKYADDRRKQEQINLKIFKEHSDLNKGEWFKIEKDKALELFT